MAESKSWMNQLLLLVTIWENTTRRSGMSWWGELLTISMANLTKILSAKWLTLKKNDHIRLYYEKIFGISLVLCFFIVVYWSNYMHIWIDQIIIHHHLAHISCSHSYQRSSEAFSSSLTTHTYGQPSTSLESHHPVCGLHQTRLDGTSNDIQPHSQTFLCSTSTHQMIFLLQLSQNHFPWLGHEYLPTTAEQSISWSGVLRRFNLLFVIALSLNTLQIDVLLCLLLIITRRLKAHNNNVLLWHLNYLNQFDQ